MKEITKRQQQALDTKNRIYQTAKSLFEKHGFNNVNLKHICEAANISTGAFYHYFRSKDDILIEQYKITDSTFSGDISELPGNTYIEKIVEYMRRFTGKAESNGVEAVREVCHAWLSRRLSFPYSDDSAVVRGLSQLLNSAYKAGEIPSNFNTKAFVLDILMVVCGIIYHWCLMEGTFSISEKTSSTLQAYFAGKLPGKRL